MNRNALIRRCSVSYLFAMLIAFPLAASAKHSETWLTTASVKRDAALHSDAGSRRQHVLRGKRLHKKEVSRKSGYLDEGENRFINPLRKVASPAISAG